MCFPRADIILLHSCLILAFLESCSKKVFFKVKTNEVLSVIQGEGVQAVERQGPLLFLPVYAIFD